MSLVVPILAQSESKAKFLQRLGLDEQVRSDKNVYSAMKAEAVEGWKRITAKREALAPKCRNNPAIKPPYTFAQINEIALQEETRHIFQTAGPQTREIYSRAHNNYVPVEENWIIRWLLWHVFRYRDDRNNSNRDRKTSLGRASPGDSEESDCHWHDGSVMPYYYPDNRSPSHEYYIMKPGPPHHGLPPQDSKTHVTPFEPPPPAKPGTARDYYDPVRDV